ncbi:hypothetical protein LPB27_13060 [Salmonella enterica subsp. enterica]
MKLNPCGTNGRWRALPPCSMPMLLYAMPHWSAKMNVIKGVVTTGEKAKDLPQRRGQATAFAVQPATGAD